MNEKQISIDDVRDDVRGRKSATVDLGKGRQPEYTLVIHEYVNSARRAAKSYTYPLNHRHTLGIGSMADILWEATHQDGSTTWHEAAPELTFSQVAAEIERHESFPLMTLKQLGPLKRYVAEPEGEFPT